MLSRESHDLPSAASAYRKARLRHPPPGFDKWYKLAKDSGAVIIEEFWDQIYHDLQPFWALSPRQIRADAQAEDMVVSIRDGKAEASTGWFWHTIWADMLNRISRHLPDMVIPCNSMDEPRLLVPWKTINDYVKKAQRSQEMPSPDKVKNVFRGWTRENKDEAMKATESEWKGSGSLSLVRQACDPTSKLGKATAADLDEASALVPEHLQDGVVANYTLSTGLCHQPDIAVHHGALNQPLTARWGQQLVPLFGGSKLRVNNEILLPPPMPWTDDPRFAAGEGADLDWNSKEARSIWRGTANGGRHQPANWYQFHRHRFTYLTNGTKIGTLESPQERILTANFMDNATFGLQSATRNHLSHFVSSTNDVGFTDLFCDPEEAEKSCWYLDDQFAIVPGVPLSQQFQKKYLPDIDGNSFSGRYRAFLLSTSVPIKATIYQEWHDSRLVAWKHFVPMDNRFIDYYKIMEYFAGFQGSDKVEAVPGHDEAARKIAYDGKYWANKVLRKEDMLIYAYRLLLEYARISADDRESLGYVGDLV